VLGWKTYPVAGREITLLGGLMRAVFGQPGRDAIGPAEAAL